MIEPDRLISADSSPSEERIDRALRPLTLMIMSDNLLLKSSLVYLLKLLVDAVSRLIIH